MPQPYLFKQQTFLWLKRVCTQDSASKTWPSVPSEGGEGQIEGGRRGSDLFSVLALCKVESPLQPILSFGRHLPAARQY